MKHNSRDKLIATLADIVDSLDKRDIQFVLDCARGLRDAQDRDDADECWIDGVHVDDIEYARKHFDLGDVSAEAIADTINSLAGEQHNSAPAPTLIDTTVPLRVLISERLDNLDVDELSQVLQFTSSVDDNGVDATLQMISEYVEPVLDEQDFAVITLFHSDGDWDWSEAIIVRNTRERNIHAFHQLVMETAIHYVKEHNVDVEVDLEPEIIAVA